MLTVVSLSNSKKGRSTVNESTGRNEYDNPAAESISAQKNMKKGIAHRKEQGRHSKQMRRKETIAPVRTGTRHSPRRNPARPVSEWPNLSKHG
ncbi:hypothetical protein AAC387_Pa10g0245 [Persea americana]